MTAATLAVQRPQDAKLMVISADGRFQHVARKTLIDLLRPGDIVVANDAATLPASLHGFHTPTGEPIEIRLAGWQSGSWHNPSLFAAVVFGAGNYHIRTEDRPLPPPMFPGDSIALGPLTATIANLLGHPRLVSIRFNGTADAIWHGLASHGRPIQYAHITKPLALWDVWTPAAAVPAAFEPPSASFVLSWTMLAEMRSRTIDFATITHAAGISSTGDEGLDRRLPLDEPYEIPTMTAEAIARARTRGGRVVAIGTTVVRALEHAALGNGNVQAGNGIATGRITGATTLAVADAIVSGVHEPGTSHYDLLRAFSNDSTLARATQELIAATYRTHEFGDSIMIESRNAHVPSR